MREVVFVNINVDSNGLYSLVQSNLHYSIRKYLSNLEIKTFQYVEENLPSIYDLADEILAYSSDVVVFNLNNDNFKLVEELSFILKDEEVEIIALGLKEDCILSKLNSTEIDMYIYDNYHENISKVLAEKTARYNEVWCKKEDYSLVDYIYGKKVEDIFYSLENMEGLNECKFINLNLTNNNEEISLDIIKSNINICEKYMKNGMIELKLSELLIINNKKSLKQVLDLVIKSNMKVKLYGNISDLEKLSKYIVFSELDEIDINLMNVDELNYSIQDSLSTLKGNLIINFYQYNGEEDLKLVKDYFKKIQLQNMIVNYIDKNLVKKNILFLSNGEIRNLPIENGVTMWKQGCYPQEVLNNTIKHVYIDSDINNEDLNDLSKLVSVNHALIMDKAIYDTKKKIQFGRHVHLIDKDSIEFEEGAFKKRLKIINYKNCETYNYEDDSELWLKINDNDDLDKFIKDVEFFNRTGVIKEYMINGFLADMCRFSCKGKCQVESIPRIEVKSNGRISCCGSNCDIGNLKNDYFDLVSNIHKKSKIEILERECLECNVKNICGSCKMLPEGIDKSKYCSVMKSKLNIDRYLISCLVIKALKGSITLKNINNQNIKVIKEKVYELFKAECCENIKVKVKDNIILIKVDEQYIMFDMITNEIMGLTPLIVYVLEGYINGYNLDQIKDIAKKDFVHESNINSYLDEANNQLLQLKVI